VELPNLRRELHIIFFRSAVRLRHRGMPVAAARAITAARISAELECTAKSKLEGPHARIFKRPTEARIRLD